MTPPHAQVPVTVRTFAQRFSATRRGARLARLLSVEQAVGWGIPRGSAALDSFALVVAELAANSVLHGCVPGRDFELRLLFDSGAGVVHVEVSDTHPRLPAANTTTDTDTDTDADGGRGLALVDALAARWGVRARVGPGKTVWAECPVSSAAP
ncbi:ATP-binding protein [Streptomyces sannanensis]|uniref:ATP-binding protein n=1 Tax=Streptomyces sannanensis TaxID=285536 RepID=A0ABP6SIX0_9ACTN